MNNGTPTHLSIDEHVRHLVTPGMNVVQKHNQVVVVTDARKDPSTMATSKSSKREFLARIPAGMQKDECGQLLKALQYMHVTYRAGAIPHEVYVSELETTVRIKITSPSEARTLVGHLINLGVMGRKVYEVSLV